VAVSDRGWVMSIEREEREEREDFDRITRGTSLRELQKLPEAELVRRCDHLLASPRLHLMLGPDAYLDELTRRRTDRQTAWVIRLTWVIAVLTFILVALELWPRISGAGH
jgi:hypothetical protein